MKDTQERGPECRLDLEKVGVTNLKTLVKTNYGGKAYRFVADVTFTIDLACDKKGVHMSRLVESITESVEEEAEKTHSSLEELCRRTLEKIGEKHPHKNAQIELETDLVVYSRTPVTGRKTMESHKVKVAVKKRGGEYLKELTVTVLGNTVCPHAMEYAGKPHIQRATAKLTVETSFDKKVDLEELINMAEESFSSRVYTLLKTEDEGKVVEDMHANPLFVEDVCRLILDKAASIKDSRIKAEVVSQESIHRHDVTASSRLTT